MIKAFNEFWIDYWKLCQESFKWLKKHWIGYIILCIVLFAITFIPAWLNARQSTKELKDLISNAPTIKKEELENL